MPLTFPASNNSTGRELLFSNRIYYVRTDGNDANNGLTNSAGGAFQTIQKAVDTACSLDLGIYSVTIKLSDGQYSGGIYLKTIIGSGKVTIEGNLSNPSNVIVDGLGSGGSNSSSLAVFESVAFASCYVISGLKIQSSSSSCRGILNNNTGSLIEYKGLVFGFGLLRHVCSFGGALRCTGNYAIESSAQTHFEISSQGKLTCDLAPTTITLINNPNFSIAFLLGTGGANIYIASFTGYVTFSGSATGTKYNLQGLSYFVGAQNNPNYLPGNQLGALAGNSVYE